MSCLQLLATALQRKLPVLVIIACVALPALSSAAAAAGGNSNVKSILHDRNNNNRAGNKYPELLGSLEQNESAILRDKTTASQGADDDAYDINSPDENDARSAKLLSFVSDNKNNVEINDANAVDIEQNDVTQNVDLVYQVHLLSKQLSALMLRRREDYELLERNLRKSLMTAKPATTIKASSGADAAADVDIRNELKQLRVEVKSLRDNRITDTKAVEWMQQSVDELRGQLQQIAETSAKDLARCSQKHEDFAATRNDLQEMKLKFVALGERQQQTEVYVQELREETMQQEEDYKRVLLTATANPSSSEQQHNSNAANMEAKSSASKPTSSVVMDVDLSLADHRRRHYRYQSEQIHKIQLAQRNMKRRLHELKFHRIDERVRSMEIEQHRIANANFNLSRQIASFDKLHSSMLELLEDVETLQNKLDKNMPEVRHEISKLEFSNSQLISEQNLMHEEGKNLARSVQAMAVSLSALQDDRVDAKQTQLSVTHLQTGVDRLQRIIEDAHNRRCDHQSHHTHPNGSNHSVIANSTKLAANNLNFNNSYVPMSEHAESLVTRLEKVEQQYEAIIDKLPLDCSEITATSSNATEGLYMIAPSDQHRPLIAHCLANGWTLVQRRSDGSVDFNRSWEDYANGFGTPTGEYWFGNEQLHHLTLQNCSSLRIVMQDIYDNIWVADYQQFYVSSRTDGYRLKVGGYKGNASDALNYQQGMQFSAIDVDRDISQTHCAANYEGGWWFSHCQHANLNGRYNLGLTWFDAARNEWIAVKSSQMLVRRNPGAGACTDSDSSAVNEASLPGDASRAPPTIASSKTAPPTTGNPFVRHMNKATSAASSVVV